MTAGELRRKLTLMPEDTTLYIHCNGEFYPVDCIHLRHEDEEAYILPIKDTAAAPKK